MFKLHKPHLSGSIHSGHFMVSRLDEDEDEDNIDPADDSSESERDNANSVEIEVDSGDINNLTVDIENPNIRREHLTSWNDLDRPSKQHQYLTYLSASSGAGSQQLLAAAGGMLSSVAASSSSSAPGLLPVVGLTRSLSPGSQLHNSATNSPIADNSTTGSGLASLVRAGVNNQLNQLHQHHQHSLQVQQQFHHNHQQPNQHHHYHHQHAVTIDTSLTKLLECMSLYYSSKLTSPKWKSFKGLKLRLKYKIRLNNLIWRAWFLQCIRGRRPPGCQFTAAPVETEQVHKKAETIVLEGKYWKRKEKAIVDEYKKWRIFHKQKSRINCFRPSSFDWESRVSSLNTTSSIYCPDYDMNITYDIDDLPPIIEEIDNRDNNNCNNTNNPETTYPQFDLGNCLALELQPQQAQLHHHQQPLQPQQQPQQHIPQLHQQPALSQPTGQPIPFPDQFYQPPPQQQPQQHHHQQHQQLQQQHLQHPNNQHNFHQLQQILQPSQAQLHQQHQQLAQLQTSNNNNNSQQQQPQQQHPLSLKREYPINMISLQNHQQQQPEPVAHLPMHHHQHQHGFSHQQQQQQQQPQHQHHQNQQHFLQLQQQSHHLQQQHHQYQQQQQQQQQQPQIQQYQRQQLNLSIDNNHLYQQLQQQLPAQAAAVTATLPTTSGPPTSSSTPAPGQQSTSPGLEIGNQQQQQQQQQQQLVIRRVCHINAEQKRRCNIKNGFDTLKSILPSINQNVNIKISKASMLQKAAVHISNLSAEQKQLLDEKLILKQQIDNLKQTINSYQSQLPASGGSVGCQSSIQAREMLQDYVRKRTLENWKFWIFSLLIEPLFDSYYNSVSANNLEDSCKTIFSWLDRSCGLFSLRKDVLESLTFLSTRTSVLNSPQTLPNEAVEAIKYQHQNQNQQLQQPQQQQQQTPF